MAALYLASTSCNARRASCAVRAFSEASGLQIGLHIAFKGFPFLVGRALLWEYSGVVSPMPRGGAWGRLMRSCKSVNRFTRADLD